MFIDLRQTPFLPELFYLHRNRGLAYISHSLYPRKKRRGEERRGQHVVLRNKEAMDLESEGYDPTD